MTWQALTCVVVRRTRAGIAGKAGRSDDSAIDIENDVDIESAGDSERGDTRRTPPSEAARA